MGFLSSIMKRATPENPSFDINSPEAWDAFDAGPKTAGVSVNRKTALTYSPWWRGVNLICRDVGKIPLITYKRMGVGKDRDKKHPAYMLLRYKPNEYQTFNIFRGQITGHAVSTGNGYAYIERLGSSKPIALLPLDPDKTLPVRENGVLWYALTNADGTMRKVDSSSILHIKGLGFDGLCGYSVIEMARESLGLGLGAQRYSVKVLTNGARPGVVLEIPGYATPAQIDYLRQTWERMHSGVDNAHRTALLEGGMKANTLSFSPEDTQLLESRVFQNREVGNWLGIPVHKLGDPTRTAYASLEQENQSYLDDALDFWLTNWEAECWDKLLSEQEKADDTHVIEFLRAALVRADLAARANYNRTALGGHPWETVNEVRGVENLNPVEGGDVIPEPLNMGNPGGADNQPADPTKTNVKPTGPNSQPMNPAKKRQQESVFAIVSDAERRVVRRIATHAEKAAKQPREFLSWLDRMGADHGETARAILAPAYEAWHAAHESDVDTKAESEKFLAGIRSELLELSGGCRPSQLLERITEWSKGKGA